MLWCLDGRASQEGLQMVGWDELVSHQTSRNRFGPFRRKVLENQRLKGLFSQDLVRPCVQGGFEASDEEQQRNKGEREMGARRTTARELQ